MNELLAELFSSKVRAAVLGHMLPRPQVALSLTEFSRILDLPISSLQHECYKLERIGVIRGPARRQLPPLPGQSPVRDPAGTDRAGRRRARSGGSRPGNPGRCSGARSRLHRADLANRRDLRRTAPAPIPLVLIGEIPLEEIDSALDRVSRLLDLPLSKFEAVFYRPGDWRARLDQHSQYAVWLVSGPRTDLVGDPMTLPNGPA